MALKIEYDEETYTLDLEDMDTDQARAMERFGVPNLRALEEGIVTGEIDALTVAFWLMKVQNGEPGQRLDRVKFKPVKFAKAIITAAAAEGERVAKEAQGNDDRD